MGILPKLLQSSVRESKYYKAGNDSISMQAQESRSRSSNTDANHEKLFNELQRIYAEVVPGESTAEKRAKHDAA
jgi:peptidyl-tRNA hydrolase ICT1